jgi:hypothetical protein
MNKPIAQAMLITLTSQQTEDKQAQYNIESCTMCDITLNWILYTQHRNKYFFGEKAIKQSTIIVLIEHTSTFTATPYKKN